MRYRIPFPKSRIEHGGVWALGRRRSRRNLKTNRPVHLVLRLDLARGKRSLLRNKKIVDRVLEKYSRRFRIRIYEFAVCGNHMHLLIRGWSRYDLQNFFRVFAGQVAQEILRQYPLQKHEEKAFRGGTPGERGGKEVCAKNQRTFWSLLAYTRIVAWGRDFGNVARYVVQNTLEALGVIPYQERKARFSPFGRDTS